MEQGGVESTPTERQGLRELCPEILAIHATKKMRWSQRPLYSLTGLEVRLRTLKDASDLMNRLDEIEEHEAT